MNVENYIKEVNAYITEIKDKKENLLNQKKQDVIKYLIKKYHSTNKQNWEKEFYDFLDAIYLMNHQQYGKNCENIVRELLKGILYNMKIESTAKNYIGDIIIQNSEEKNIVIEIKSLISDREKGDKNQNFTFLKKRKDMVINKYKYNEYIVFASCCVYGKKTEKKVKNIWENNKDWIVVQSWKEDSKICVPVWEVYKKYMPFNELVKKIRSV